jgi:hypothetical protein
MGEWVGEEPNHSTARKPGLLSILSALIDSFLDRDIRGIKYTGK